MDRKLLLKRLEIVLAVALIVVVVLGIAFFIFRSMPTPETTPIASDGLGLLPGFPADPNESIKFLDISNQKEFTAANKKVILPGEDTVLQAYNNTSTTNFTCKNDFSSDCTIYEISNAGRTFYMSAPIVLKLKNPTSSASIKKKLDVSGEQVEFTYTQIKYYDAVLNDAGEITDTKENPSLTTVEEIYGCLSTNVCFNSGILSSDKATNPLDIAAFEQFVQSVVVQ